MIGAMTAHVIFPKNERRKELNFYGCVGVEIESSWRNLTDTAKVVFPRSYRYRYQKLKEHIWRNDRIVIRLGYNNRNYNEFTGFVTEVGNDTPVEIKCEDNMFLLKQITINKLFRKVNLRELIRQIVPLEFHTDVVDVEFGNYDAENMGVAEILEDIKRQTGLYSYFSGNTLVCGKIYSDNKDERIHLSFGKNIIESSLKYGGEDKIIVEASSITNGKKLKATAGEKGGRIVRIKRKGASLQALKKMANGKLEMLKKEKLSGDVTSFGFPFAVHGDKVEISDNELDRNGTFYIDAVKVNFDSGGFRRTIKTGKAVK